MINAREILVKTYLENLFIPYLDNLFKTSNPSKYNLYQGNFCRQASIYGTLLLEDLLPEYQWESWEAEFTDIVQGKPVRYEHAWIYGKNKREKRYLLIDLTRNFQERLFIEVPKNRYPKNHLEYKHMVEIKKKLIPIANRMGEYEFYTGLQAKVILDRFKEIAHFYQFVNELNGSDEVN